MTTKPDLIQRTWGASAPPANIADPGNTKYGEGWGVEVPPMQFFNFIQKLTTQAIAHVNEYGIMQWDSVTTYPVNAWARSTVDGKVYRAKTSNAGNEPSASGTQWEDVLGSITSPAWSETVAGIVERASQAEAEAGTDNTRGMSPLRVAQAISAQATVTPDWSTTTKGKVEKATQAEGDAGVDNERGMTPFLVRSAIDGRVATLVPSATTTAQGKIELATTTEATTGTDTTRAMTPSTTRSAIDNRVPQGTTTVQGKLELATNTEAVAGADTARAVTPAGLSAAISASGGVATLRSTRTTTGTWSITGLTIGKPLTVVFQIPATGNYYATYDVISGTADNDVYTGGAYIIGREASTVSGKSFTVIPSATTVSIDVNTITAGATLRAYQ